MTDRVTAREASGILGYHINYFYELLRNGTVKAEQFNRVWIIERDEIQRIKALQGSGGRLPKSEPKQA